MKRIYLDYAAATPLDPRVLQIMMPWLTTEFGNPSSLHYWGQQARAAVQKAREQVAHCLRVSAEELIFTSGGTEADNLAIRGYLRANHPEGGHIITTAVEHQAVLHTFSALAREGYTVTILPVNNVGRVDAEDVRKALRKDTVLISCMYANNETGMIQPIADIGNIARDHHIIFHVDAVQAFGYLPVYPQKDHIDLLSICSHKIYGPKGMGTLYIRKGIEISSEAYGGPQERHLRAGTENVAGIVGFGAAAAILEKERQQRYEQVKKLKKYMYETFSMNSAMFHLNGEWEHSLPNILDFSISGIDNAVLLIALDMQGIGVSAGSACEAGAVEPSHVLKAMGLPEKWAHSSVRVSFGAETTMEQVKEAVEIINRTVTDMLGKEEYHG